MCGHIGWHLKIFLFDFAIAIKFHIILFPEKKHFTADICDEIYEKSNGRSRMWKIHNWKWISQLWTVVQFALCWLDFSLKFDYQNKNAWSQLCENSKIILYSDGQFGIALHWLELKSESKIKRIKFHLCLIISIWWNRYRCHNVAQSRRRHGTKILHRNPNDAKRKWIVFLTCYKPMGDSIAHRFSK